jgi:hypothetical protein
MLYYDLRGVQAVLYHTAPVQCVGAPQFDVEGLCDVGWGLWLYLRIATAHSGLRQPVAHHVLQLPTQHFGNRRFQWRQFVERVLEAATATRQRHSYQDHKIQTLEY